MEIEEIDYSELRARAIQTDILVFTVLMLILIVALLTFDFWLAVLVLIGIVSVWILYHYTIKISRYLDFLDDDTPDPEI